MRKQIIEEVLLDKCPNCGAARRGEEEACTYCGGSLVQTRRVTESVEEEPVKAVPEDDRKVDIISKIEPIEDNAEMYFGIGFALIWLAIAGIMAGGAIGMGEPLFALIAVAIGVFGAALVFTSTAAKRLKYTKLLVQGTQYPAVVLGYGSEKVVYDESDSDGHSRGTRTEEKIKVKVLAEIEGVEKCILLTAPTSVSELSHPIGCPITIVGLGDDYVIKL